jgi:hypothetical protein
MERRVTRLASASINTSTAERDNLPPTALTPKATSEIIMADTTVREPGSIDLQKDGLGKMLEHINSTMCDLTKSMELLQTKTSDLNANFDKLRVDIGNDLKDTKATFDDKFKKLEDRISTEQKSNYEELKAILKDQKENTNTDITNIRSHMATEEIKTREIQNKVCTQDEHIAELEKTIQANSALLKELREELVLQTQRTDERFIRAQANVDDNSEWINDVESHGRRWAVKIVGLKAPTKFETSDETKDLALQFFANDMQTNNIRLDDLDCAHRIGVIKNHKQAILVRFFRRNFVEQLMKIKNNLKGKGVALLEDTSGRNKKLLNILKDRSEVESSWHVGGKVWMKLKSGGKKIRISITDDIDEMCNPQLGLFQYKDDEEAEAKDATETPIENDKVDALVVNTQTTHPDEEGDENVDLVLNAS